MLIGSYKYPEQSVPGLMNLKGQTLGTHIFLQISTRTLCPRLTNTSNSNHIRHGILTGGQLCL